MQPQVDTASSAAQSAHVQLAHIEAIVVRKIQEAHHYAVRIGQMQAESGRQLEILRTEKAARIHAERMQAALELRLDDLDQQNSDLGIVLGALVEAVEMPASCDRDVLLAKRLEVAKYELERRVSSSGQYTGAFFQRHKAQLHMAVDLAVDSEASA